MYYAYIDSPQGDSAGQGMSTFVLIHGGWHGGWCWQRVVPLLLDMGHQVIAPDLPGHGSKTTTPASRPYEQYVTSVCNILDAQNDAVVLVGHSSGGAVISAVAEERGTKISVLVVLTAFLLPSGVMPRSVAQEDRESLLQSYLVIDPEGLTVSVTPEGARRVFYSDCTEEDAEWATSLLVPEPLIPPRPTAPSIPKPRCWQGPKVYIECLQDRALGPSMQRKMYTESPCDKVYSLQCALLKRVGQPHEVARAILFLASDEASYGTGTHLMVDGGYTAI
jgi:pimeloyl-ACP methyl ester carboxylesterase